VEGLLESQIYDIAKATLENFMDELDQFGFIPNGGRIYCKKKLLSESNIY
jgi:alpha,alpha-trehalase